MKVRRRLSLVGLVLLLAAPLVLILRDVARNVIVVQLLRILWIGRILFESIPQLPLWALFLVVAASIAVRSLIKGRQPLQKVTIVEADSSRVGDYPGRIQVLARWIQRAAEGEYFRWGLVQYLEELILEVLAHHEGATLGQMRQRLRTGRLDAPPEIQAFLQTKQRPTFSRPASLLSWLRRRLQSSTEELWSQTSPSAPDLESIVQFLEDQLEVQHDYGPSHRNR